MGYRSYSQTPLPPEMYDLRPEEMERLDKEYKANYTKPGNCPVRMTRPRGPMGTARAQLCEGCCDFFGACVDYTKEESGL